MEPPGITRHRRPFLAPLWLGLLAALAVAGVAWALLIAQTGIKAALATGMGTAGWGLGAR